MTEVPYDWARMQKVKMMHRSVSQASNYLEDLGGCRYRYFLSRIALAWDRPAAWLPQGTAVHTAAEWWEKGGRKGSLAEMQEVCKRAYREAIAGYLAETPNTDEWFASGKHVGGADIKRRGDFAVDQCAKYYNYYVNQKPGEVIWVTPDGTPAIELEFLERFGSVWVKGYIDQIIEEIVAHSLKVRDIKTGINPGGLFQVSTYRFAILAKYGVDILLGDYWMARNGGPTNAYDLTGMSLEQATDLYERTDEGIKAENFDPSPSTERCGRCGVATACQYAM